MAVPGGLALAVAALLAVMGGVACDLDRPLPAFSPTLIVDRDTRLLVFAPHPDDEVLAAGGLIQQVREAGGIVHVIYVTSGDAYIESVKIEEHVANPTTTDYRDYGQQRESEARVAMRSPDHQESLDQFLRAVQRRHGRAGARDLPPGARPASACRLVGSAAGVRT